MNMPWCRLHRVMMLFSQSLQVFQVFRWPLVLFLKSALLSDRTFTLKLCPIGAQPRIEFLLVLVVEWSAF